MANNIIPFNHLHVHTQFSLLDGAASIKGMLSKAKDDGMQACAITDHGNMFGVFKFVAVANELGVKPIIGCEFYLTDNRFQKVFTKENKDKRYHQLLLAKTEEGYRNLIKLCSLGYIDGMYGKYPRIDKELLAQYHKGIIATTCCIGAEIPQTILHKGEEEAEKVFQWYLELFGEDYYIELQRHKLENLDNSGISQEDINQILLKWSAKYNVKVIATNDSHYVDEDDWTAHDILLCVNTGDKVSTPIGEGKDYRFGFPNSNFYFKTQAEMNKLFADVPQALDNTNEIVEKTFKPNLKRDILLPNFTLPDGFKSMDDYLRHLSFQGAKYHYGSISKEIEDRINFELDVITKMGFSGYFLIVQDFISAARKMKVAVGPGRGSAAGSVVAFCTGITNIDPIKYNLLFERFLNPERVSMPDIDIDFDDDGRQSVIDYVVDKYGKTQVAQIVTYGTMAAKMSIKDVARVLDLPLDEANRLAKMIPDTPGISLKDAMNENPDFKVMAQRKDLHGNVVQAALKLEGSVRNTGIHAAGVIIAPDDITNYIPVCTSKDADLFVTQFDGKVIENAGMLKMDFLGLKTLSIINDAIKLIEVNHGVLIDIDKIALDDEKTIELYQRGETIGTFQFESAGMQKHLRSLKPTDIEDLIAMNALFRPGPMDYIDSFIRRKHGDEQIVYPHPMLEEILKPTYGIMVYQEQIMQTAQILGGYSLGKADLLRRAMGKKDPATMQKQESIFIDGAKEANNIDAKKAKDVFEIMLKFAQYGFNRSHAAAYSVLAFQTAYLKAHYPAEYMAAVMSRNMSDVKKVSFFMDETRKMGIEVLNPDVNESFLRFTVNKKGAIRFGLGAIKGVGENAVDSIVKERTENGLFQSIYDLTTRCDHKMMNKRTFEALAMAGALDGFPKMHRAMYFFQDKDGQSFLEKAIKYGIMQQHDALSSQHSLFDDTSTSILPEPELPNCPEMESLSMLKLEKETTGIFISGHPLDQFNFELQYFCTHTLDVFDDIEEMENKEVIVGGLVNNVSHRLSQKNNNPWGSISLEDKASQTEIRLFGEDYIKYKEYMQAGLFLYITGKFARPTYRFQKEGDAQPEIRFMIKSIELLNGVMDKKTKSLLLEVDVEKLNNENMQKLNTVLLDNPGTSDVFINLSYMPEKLKVSSKSLNKKVKLSDKLMQDINKIKGIFAGVQ